MDSNSILSPDPNIAFSQVEDEFILMSMDNGAFYVLDGSAAAVWGQIQQSKSFSDLVAALVQEFDVDQATCEQDCTALLEDLIAKKLVSVA